MEMLMRDEKESWKGFIEEVTFELSFKKRWVGSLQIKGKGEKKSNSGKGRCETVLYVQETGLVEMEVTVNKKGGRSCEDPARAKLVRQRADDGEPYMSCCPGVTEGFQAWELLQEQGLSYKQNSGSY